MRTLLIRLRTWLVRLGFEIGRRRPIRAARRARDVPRGRARREPALHRGRAGAAAAADPDGRPRVAARPGCAASSAGWSSAPRRLPPRGRAAVRRRRLLLPDVRHHGRAAARCGSRCGTRPGRSRSSATASSTSRSGPTRRSSPGGHPLQLHPLPWCRRWRSPPSTTRRRSGSRGSCSRRARAAADRPVRRRCAAAPAPRRPSGERYGLPPGRRVVLYAPTFRGDTVHAPATTTCSTCGAARGARRRRGSCC